MRPGRLALLCIIVALLPDAQAAAPSFQGHVTVTAIVASGPSDVAAHAVAVYGNYSEAEAATASWTSTPADVTVNWTRNDGTSYGSMPGNPEAGITFVEGSYAVDETQHRDASLIARPMNAEAKILIIGALDIQGSFSGFSSTMNEAGANWSLGWFSNPQSVNRATTPIARHQFNAPSGTPILAAEGTNGVTTNGQTAAYLWGFEVTVQTPEGSRVYQSGTWSDNPTPSTGPARATQERHYQLLRISLNSSTSLQQTDGGLRVAASQAEASTTGPLLLRNATGLLEAEREAYPFEGDDARLPSGATIRFAADPTRTLLEAILSTSSAPSGVLAISKTVPTGHNSNWMVVGLSVAVLIIVAGGLVWWHREAPAREFWASDRLAVMIGANPEKAERKIRAHLKRRPGDIDFVVMHAQAYLALGRNRELLREFDKFLGRGGRQVPVLAFIMAKASARLRRHGRTLTLVTAASRDPDVRNQVLEDKELAPFLQQLLKPAPKAEASNIAYV